MLSIPLNARRLGGGRWGPSYDHGEVTRWAQYTPHLPILQPRETGLLFSQEKLYAVENFRPFGHSKLTRKRIFKVTSIVWLMVCWCWFWYSSWNGLGGVATGSGCCPSLPCLLPRSPRIPSLLDSCQDLGEAGQPLPSPGHKGHPPAPS